MKLSLITRTSEPTKLDTAEYGTLCKVSNLNGSVYYIQLNKNEDEPRWTFLDCDDEEAARQKASELR